MGVGEWLALTMVWWACDHPRIRKALNAALLHTWVPKVEGAMVARDITGGTASDWYELQAIQALNRHRSTVRRVADGENNATNELLLGLASLLGLEVQTFYPSTVEWIALATLYLTSAERWQHGTLDESALRRTRVYAEFRLAHPPTDGTPLTDEKVEWLLDTAKAEDRSAIRAVAKELGPSLTDLYPHAKGGKRVHA